MFIKATVIENYANMTVKQILVLNQFRVDKPMNVQTVNVKLLTKNITLQIMFIIAFMNAEHFVIQLYLTKILHLKMFIKVMVIENYVSTIVKQILVLNQFRVDKPMNA